MKRFLKWFFGIFIFLIIVVVGLAISLPYLIDPNQYKDELIAQIKPHMRGRDLQIPGDIKISVLPWLGFEVGKVVIGNADGFVLKPFMTVGQAKAHIKLLSLLSDTPEIGSLEFSDIDVLLQRDAEGRNNWSDLSQAGDKPATPKPAATPASTAFAIPLLKVQGLHFTDVTIWIEDKQAKDTLTISKLNIDAGPIDQLKPIPISGKFNFHSKKSELASASAFAANLVLSQDFNDIKFEQLTLNTNVSGAIVDNNTIKTGLKVPSLNIDLAKQTVTAKPFNLKLNDMDSEGRLDLRRFENPVVRLGWEIQKLDLDALLPAMQKPAAKPAQVEADIPQIAAIETGEKVDNSAKILAPLAAFKNADLQGTIKIGQLRVKKLDLSEVKINLLARGGLVSALPEAKLYGGSYKGDLQIQTRTKPVTLRSKQEVRKVAIGPIIKALYGKESLTGDVNFVGQFFSEGDSQAAITSHLNGDGQFHVSNAELKAVDMKEMILGKWYDKVKFVQEKDPDKEVRAFDSMRGSIRIKSGVAYNKDFLALSQRVHLRGDGFANLNDTQVKYTLNIIPKKSLAFSLGGHTYELKDKQIPTHISGSWTNPQIDNDIEEIYKEEFKQTELYKKTQAEQEKAKEKLKHEEDKLKDKVKNLFKK